MARRMIILAMFAAPYVSTKRSSVVVKGQGGILLWIEWRFDLSAHLELFERLEQPAKSQQLGDLEDLEKSQQTRLLAATSVILD